MIDVNALRRKFIGPLNSRDDSVMLRDRFIQTLIEQVSLNFGERFRYAFSITGDRVTKPEDIT